MTNFLEVREIPIDALVMGSGQVRLRKIEAEIDDLVVSIRVHGLLEPILVCPHDGDEETYEVLAGQRRVLACRKLGWSSITATIGEKPADEDNAKAISLTENIIRRDLDTKDIIDACTSLYRKYGNARAVADETGIPYAQVLKHLKYDRLTPTLRMKVDAGEVDLNMALKAQDAVTNKEGEVNAQEAVDLADALATMTGAERQQVMREKKENPLEPVKQILQDFWNKNEKNRQMVVTLPANTHKAIQDLAKKEGVTQDQFTANLVCDRVKMLLEEQGEQESGKH